MGLPAPGSPTPYTDHRWSGSHEPLTPHDEDRERSPRTGYTRAHWEAVADALLTAAWRWSSPRGALLDLPGPPSVSGVRSDGLEGFARTLLTAAHRVAGAGGADPHYSRLAYSSRTGPTPVGNPADNHFAVVWRGVRSVRRRVPPLGAGHGDGWGWAASWHRPVFDGGSPVLPGLRVESVVVARGRHELRVHRVVGAPHGLGTELTGWAVGPDEPLSSSLEPLHGWSGRDGVRAPAGTAFTPWTCVPRLTGTVSGTAVCVALAALTGEHGPQEAATGPGPTAPVAGVTVADGGVEVRWAEDGALTRIAFDPLEVAQE